MNEKGFFTLIGLCFLLVAAILVKGVQESEKNYSNITTDFHTEVDLQNVAESALIEAMNMIAPNDVEKVVPKRNVSENRRHYQPQIFLKSIDKNTTVKVFAEYGIDQSNDNIGTIQSMEREYKSGNVINDKPIDTPKKGVILISVASREIDGNKFYRRAIGYFLTDGDQNNLDKAKKPKEYIYFMNSLD